MENEPTTNQLPSNPVIQLPSKSNSFLIILLSILLFIALTIAGFFAFQTQKLVKELRVVRDELTQTPTASTKPTSDPTADLSRAESKDWKTYSNSKYNFTFKYPKYLENRGSIAGPYTGTSIAIQSFSDAKTMREGTDAPFDGFSLYFVTDTKAQNFETFIQNEKFAMDNAEYAAMSGARRVNLLANGVAFVTDMRGYYYFPSADGKQVVVLGYIQLNQSFKLVFDQILSTFKFTN